MANIYLNAQKDRKTFVDNETNPSYKESDVAMLGIACDLTASASKGTWHGPNAIVQASYQVEYEVPIFHSKLTDKIKIHNIGTLECPRYDNLTEEERQEMTGRWMDEMVSRTKDQALKVIRDKKLLMLFGGEHSVPNGVWNAIGNAYDPSSVTILQLDAHLDLRDALEGHHYSHGSIMRRARDKGFRTIHVGIRDHISGEEAAYIKSQKMKHDIFFCPTQPWELYRDFLPAIQDRAVVDMGNLIEGDALCHDQMVSLERKIGDAKHLWVTIDVDGLDASHIPGTGTPLPYGLSRTAVRDILFKAINTAKREKVHLIGFDINEVSPLMKNEGKYEITKTQGTISETYAAQLAYNMLFWQFLDRFTK